MLSKELGNRVVEEVEWFRDEHEGEYTKQMAFDYLRTLDFNSEQRAYFLKLLGF